MLSVIIKLCMKCNQWVKEKEMMQWHLDGLPYYFKIIRYSQDKGRSIPLAESLEVVGHSPTGGEGSGWEGQDLKLDRGV